MGISRSILRLGLGTLLLASGCSRSARYESLEPTSRWIERDQQVLFFDALDSGGHGLFAIRLDGGSRREVVKGRVRDYVLSSDGTKVAYRGGSSSCGTVHLPSGTERPLAEPCKSLDWSPDGRLLAYTTETEDYEGTLRLLDWSSGDTVKLIETGGPIVGPRWSRDGTRLYFWDLFSEVLYVAHPASRSVREIGVVDDPSEYLHTVVGLGNLHFNQYAATGIGWSRMRSPSGARQAVTREGSLFVVDSGGSETLLLENSGAYNVDFGPRGFDCPAWTPDERFILGDVSDQVIAVDAASGRAGVVTSGHHPLAHIPQYHPGEDRRITPLYYSQMRMAGR
jgi:hypothetical protein